MNTSLLMCLLITSACGQILRNMTFEGKERSYVIYVPSAAPTGLIVALNPVAEDQNMNICQYSVGTVSQTTGALVVCPAALRRPGVKPGSGSGPCWKAWANFSTCESVENNAEDVEFLATLIQQLQQQYTVPEKKIIMSGMSNGGSMAYRFNCEKSDLIGGLVIQSQSYLDPYVGFYDYENQRVPTGPPQCHPRHKLPFYSDIGTNDVYYASSGFSDWQKYSTQVLGCSGDYSVTSQGPHDFPQGSPTTCYEYPSCPGIVAPGINRYCNVTGMMHDATGLQVILPKAFADFFGGPQPPSPSPTKKDFVCYQGTCYSKPGHGTMDKETCSKTCSAPGPSPGPSPSKGDYICYQGKCYNKPGEGTMDKDTCQRTCQKSFLSDVVV